MKKTMKAFISYATADKRHGRAVHRLLGNIDIDSFLAPETVTVSEKWERRLREELAVCTIFIAILSQAFKASSWCNQELGFIKRRGKSVLIIPLSVDGTDTYGFIFDLQAHKMGSKGLDPATLINVIGRKWPGVAIDALIKPLTRVGTFREANLALAPLVPYFSRLTTQQANEIADLAINNDQIWDAHICRDEYLPQFLRDGRTKLKASLYRALRYQITNRKRLPEKARRGVQSRRL